MPLIPVSPTQRLVEKYFFQDNKGSGLAMSRNRYSNGQLSPYVTEIPGRLTDAVRAARTDLLTYEGAEIQSIDSGDTYVVKDGAWTLKAPLGGAAALNYNTSKIDSIIRTQQDFQRAVTYLDQHPVGGYFDMDKDFVLESPVQVNTAKVGINGNGAKLQAGNITGNYAAITLKYNHPDYNGYKRYNFAPFVIRDLTLIGPGHLWQTQAVPDVAAGLGNSGICLDGDVGAPQNRAVRPSLQNLTLFGWDRAYDLKNVAFLGMWLNPIVYDSGLAYHQRSANDSGECCRIFGGLTQRARLGWLLEDDTSEFFVYGMSIDYGIQAAVIRPNSSWGAMAFHGCHTEIRGHERTGDPGYYAAKGKGNDTRCLIPSRDRMFDIAGNGSTIRYMDGIFDLNGSGDVAPPWDIGALVAVHHRNSSFIMRDTVRSSLQNINNVFAIGPGNVEVSGGQVLFPSDLSFPSRISQAHHLNKLSNPAFASAAGLDMWTIRRDTAEITDRFTGANASFQRQSNGSFQRVTTIAPALTLSAVGTGSRTVVSNGEETFHQGMVGKNFVVGSGVGSITSVDNPRQLTINVTAAFASTDISANTAVVRSTASLEVTKVGAAGTVSEIACFVPVTPGQQITVHGYYYVPATGGMTGVPSISYRWCGLSNPRNSPFTGLVPVIFSSAIAGEATKPLATAWQGPTGAYDLVFSDGSVKTTTLTKGSTTVAWTGNVTATVLAFVKATENWTTYAASVPVQGLPDSVGPDWELGTRRSAGFCKSADLSVATTGQYIAFSLGVPVVENLGEMQAPQWATHAEILLNLTSAGAGKIYLCDLVVSQC